MAQLVIIGGTSTRGTEVERGGRRSAHGVTVVDRGDHLALDRHGLDDPVPAHRIDHAATARALRDAGITHAVGLASSGSLRPDWPVGTTVCPDDFYAPAVTVSLFDDFDGHSVPGFDAEWRAEVLAAWSRATTTPIVGHGVYAQTTGPRFETPAEVRALSRVADLVGMTMAGECIVMREAGIRYAGICIVDNLANGLEPEPLTMEEYRAGAEANRRRFVADVESLTSRLVAQVGRS